MSKFFVTQPDGKSALFCGVSDQFVVWDIAAEELDEVYERESRRHKQPEHWRHASSTKFHGVELANAADGPLARWNRCLLMVGLNCGSDDLDTRYLAIQDCLDAMNLGEYKTPYWVDMELEAASSSRPLADSLPPAPQVPTPSIMEDAFWEAEMPRAAVQA